MPSTYTHRLWCALLLESVGTLTIEWKKIRVDVWALILEIFHYIEIIRTYWKGWVIFNCYLYLSVFPTRFINYKC